MHTAMPHANVGFAAPAIRVATAADAAARRWAEMKQNAA